MLPQGVDSLTSQRRIQGNHNLVPRKKDPIMTFHSLDQAELDPAGKPAQWKQTEIRR